jgi:membrane-associated phospholipid phosphatase
MARVVGPAGPSAGQAAPRAVASGTARPGPAIQGPERPGRRRRHEESIAELVVGSALVLTVALGGLYFAVRPGPATVDGWLLNLVRPSHALAFTHVSSLTSPAAIVIGAAIAAGACLPRDRPRALACLIAPPLALLACELVAKPLVDRTLGGVLSYPSGSTVGAAALAAAAVLATPARWRPWIAGPALAYSLWVALAVVALRWHYPTDALAGLALGAGVVLVIDGAAFRIACRADRPQIGNAAPDGAPRPRADR